MPTATCIPYGTRRGLTARSRAGYLRVPSCAGARLEFMLGGWMLMAWRRLDYLKVLRLRLGGAVQRVVLIP